MNLSKKTIIAGIIGALVLILSIWFNPCSWNDAGNRTVVEEASGNQWVQFKPGVFYSGFFSKTKEWPNQISVSYQDSIQALELKDNMIEIGFIKGRFNDGSIGTGKGITQYLLPADEKQMILLHNVHRTPEALVQKRLSSYTKECFGAAAQLMSSEMHYSGGKAQMSQDYLNQLQNGVYLLEVKEKQEFDTLTKENKITYQTKIQMNTDGSPKRKVSSIKEYGIEVADAAITDVIYEDRIQALLGKKIDAATKASVAKQEAVTAQQQALTAKAKGEQALVEIEYKTKQVQTKQVVEAETKVALAEQDKLQQKIAADAAVEEARKIKTLADAEAYQRRTTMQADGYAQAKIDALVQINEAWAKAAEGSQWVPTTMLNGGGFNGTGAHSPTFLMDMMNAKFANDLNVSLKPTK